MRFVIAGNWKLNKSPTEAATFFIEWKKNFTPHADRECVIFPTALVASCVAEHSKSADIKWGGQNCYFEAKGAFTGENSAAILAEMGANFVLVGHSERRKIFNESDELLSKKLAAAQKFGLTPMLCLGETLDERNANKTEVVIERQLRIGLNERVPGYPIYLAYEPVWAIGTGVVASVGQVAHAHAFIQKVLGNILSPDEIARTPVLYGGSVNAENCRELANVPFLNGFLVGGASLDPKVFLSIYNVQLSGRQ